MNVYGHKPAGFESFTNITEKGFLDNLEVFELVEGTQRDWEQRKQMLIHKMVTILQKPTKYE